MTKKIKNTSKLEIPKDIPKEKSIIEKFAPENKVAAKSDSKPINQIANLFDDLKGVFVDEKELLEYMDSAIKDNVKAHAKSKGKQMDEVFKTLDHIMPEFYQNCMIFGFNALGEKTVYMYAPTEKDKDALFHHVKTTVFNLGG
jgi:hypothetical protein